MGQTRKVSGRFNEFDRMIISRRLAMDLSIFPQYGGAINQGIVSVNGFNYNYTEDYKAGAYTIYAGRPRRKFECFLLFVNKNKIAELHSMRQSSDCALQDNSTSHNLLHAALTLAKEKGATRIELTDTANKRLPYDKSFRLSNMYFLTTGHTWYEIHGGFHPISSDSKYVSRWRQSAFTNSWDKIYSCLLERIPDIRIPVNISDINGKAEGSAMEVFLRIKDSRSTFFADYQRDLMECSNIGALETIIWYREV